MQAPYCALRHLGGYASEDENGIKEGTEAYKVVTNPVLY